MQQNSDISDFQKAVYESLKKIPKGKVTTYKALAKYLNCGSPRAIGQALKRNPFAPQVPCHRVISSNLQIGGFCGETSGNKIKKKLKLLKNEGVTFKNGKLMDKNQLFLFQN